jgi:hypothetical protein
VKVGLKVHFLHHLIGAVMLFSVLHCAEHYEVLEWLDAAMIRIAADGSRADPATLARAERERPSIVQIERDAFETVFDDQSPLARAPLVELLDQIDARRTGLLAVDIDLAPSRAERAAGGARPLDVALAALSARGVKVVLGLPPPAASTPGATLAWVRARCAEGIVFADPDLQERLGVVSRVRIDRPTLAHVAHLIHSGGNAHEAGAICALAADEKDEGAFFAEVRGEAEHGAEEGGAPRPLNAVASNWAFLRKATHAVALRDGHAAIEDAGALRRVVFLGGAYADAERFTTIGGPASGVQVHAASYTSLALGTRDAEVWRVALADIVPGLLLGFMFQWMWLGFSGVVGWVGHYTGTLAWYGRFYMMRVVLLACWLWPLLLAYGAVRLSSWLFTEGMWLNPGPIIIGMFLHTLSLRHHDAQHGDGAHAHGAFGTLLREHPATLLIQLPLTAILLVASGLH